MSANIFIPANAIERGLMKLPKNCNCIICNFQKAEAKAKLGENRFNEVSEKIVLKK